MNLFDLGGPQKFGDVVRIRNTLKPFASAVVRSDNGEVLVRLPKRLGVERSEFGIVLRSKRPAEFYVFRTPGKDMLGRADAARLVGLHL